MRGPKYFVIKVATWGKARATNFQLRNSKRFWILYPDIRGLDRISPEFLVREVLFPLIP